MIKEESEITRPKKFKKKKSPTKSDHKHIYETVLMYVSYDKEVTQELTIGSRCTVCGKITFYEGPFKDFLEIRCVEGRRAFRLLTSEELLEKYKDLPIVKYNW
jgi:hypothetical protein